MLCVPNEVEICGEAKQLLKGKRDLITDLRSGSSNILSIKFHSQFIISRFKRLQIDTNICRLF